MADEDLGDKDRVHIDNLQPSHIDASALLDDVSVTPYECEIDQLQLEPTHLGNQTKRKINCNDLSSKAISKKK